MKTSSVLAMVGVDADTRAAEIATRLHIPCFHTQTQDSVDDCDDECRIIATYLSENGNRFSVVSVSEASLFYPPTALMLAARTTVCYLGDTVCDTADLSLPTDASVDTIIGAWLSPQILSSFEGKS